MGTDAGIPFGNYTLLKRIARGGMAEVFVARQEGMDGFDRMVAIKRILPHLLDDQSFVRMFQDEARLAARLSHPNVIHIYDFGKVDEHFFIAMELMHAVHAGDLIRLASEKKMPPGLVARIGANACAGLHYAHNRKDNLGNPLKLVHRDVSPPNLLISYDGVVKLVDFGIAKAVSSIEQTRPGVVKGKYAFMSPEQTMGQSLDGRSDVFSLGLVLWELLAGRNAVTRDDQILAMQTIRDGKVPPIASVRKDVPAKLASALHDALQKSPDKRSDARQFGKELEAFVKSSKEIATNMELGAWLTEHLPPSPVVLGDEDSPGTKRATVATSLHSLSEIEGEGPANMVFGHPAEDRAGEDEDEGAEVTKLVNMVKVADLPSVKGDLTQDSREPTPQPIEGADSVVVAMDLISQEARKVGQPTPTTRAYPSASNEDSLDDSRDESAQDSEHGAVLKSDDDAVLASGGGAVLASGDGAVLASGGGAVLASGGGAVLASGDGAIEDEPKSVFAVETEEDVTSVDDDVPLSAITKDAATVVGHGFATKAAGLDDMDEPTNDLAGPTEVDDTQDDETVEDQRAVGSEGYADEETIKLAVPTTAQMLSQARASSQHAHRGDFARLAPWAAGAVAIVVLLVVASLGDSTQADKPAVEEPERQPIVFDPEEAAAYQRDGSTGLPPIVVTPLPDGGQTQSPPETAPETTLEASPDTTLEASPDTTPDTTLEASPDLVMPDKERKSRHRRDRAAKNMGHLKVKSRPQSIVYHRSDKLGTTPLSDLPLKAGRYRLRFVAKGRVSETRDVVIRAGQVTSLDLDLRP